MKQFAVEGDDSKPNSPIQKLINGTLGIPVLLTTTPTTAGNELSRHGDNGFCSADDSFYINLFGRTFKISLTAT